MALLLCVLGEQGTPCLHRHCQVLLLGLSGARSHHRNRWSWCCPSSGCSLSPCCLQLVRWRWGGCVGLAGRRCCGSARQCPREPCSEGSRCRATVAQRAGGHEPLSLQSSASLLAVGRGCRAASTFLPAAALAQSHLLPEQVPCAGGRVAVSWCRVLVRECCHTALGTSPLARHAGAHLAQRTAVLISPLAPGSGLAGPGSGEVLANPNRDFLLLLRVPRAAGQGVRGGEVPSLGAGDSGTRGDGHNVHWAEVGPEAGVMAARPRWAACSPWAQPWLSVPGGEGTGG